MKMLNYKDFMRDFGKIAKQTMNLSIYNGQWQCACGKSHNFNEHALDIIGQGAVMRLMIMCPDDPHYVTNVKIKTFMVFKWNLSVIGTGAITHRDSGNLTHWDSQITALMVVRVARAQASFG